MLLLPSELYWLTRHFKCYPIPSLIYSSSCEFCGYYHWPNNSTTLNIDGLEYSTPHGAIVLGADPGPATIAHEYRHHLQLMSGGKKWFTDLRLIGKVEYITTQISEEDAFRFELRLAPEDMALEWRDIAKFPVPGRTDLLSYIPQVVDSQRRVG